MLGNGSSIIDQSLAYIRHVFTAKLFFSFATTLLLQKMLHIYNLCRSTTLSYDGNDCSCKHGFRNLCTYVVVANCCHVCSVYGSDKLWLVRNCTDLNRFRFYLHSCCHGCFTATTIPPAHPDSSFVGSFVGSFDGSSGNGSNGSFVQARRRQVCTNVSQNILNAFLKTNTSFS
jgi:hypothetical protein